MALDGQARPPALEIRGLTKRYDDGTLALDALDLTIPDGAFFGLLGPNGAGKTTLINSVTGLVRVTAGSIRVFGHDHATMEARRLIGLVTDLPVGHGEDVVGLVPIREGRRLADYAASIDREHLPTR